MKKTILILAAAILSTTFLFAQKPEVITSNTPGWHKIGETTVSFKSDKDEIVVLGADKFRAVQIRAIDAPVHVDKFTVVYENGNNEEINVRADFRPKDFSRVIDLNGGDRKLKKVILVYTTIPNWKGERAHLELWGLK